MNDQREYFTVRLMNGEYGILIKSLEFGVDFEEHIRDRSKPAIISALNDLNSTIKRLNKPTQHLHD